MKMKNVSEARAVENPPNVLRNVRNTVFTKVCKKDKVFLKSM